MPSVRDRTTSTSCAGSVAFDARAAWQSASVLGRLFGRYDRVETFQ